MNTQSLLEAWLVLSPVQGHLQQSPSASKPCCYADALPRRDDVEQCTCQGSKSMNEDATMCGRPEIQQVTYAKRRFYLAASRGKLA